MLVLSFFVVLMLGVYFGKLKIDIKKVDFELLGKNKIKNTFDIKFGIYLFGIIKILGITFKENGISFLGVKISYETIKNTKFYQRAIEKDMMNFDKRLIKESLKKLKFSLEKINFNLKFGTNSTIITSFITFFTSTALSILIQKSVKKYNGKKHRFVITPVYENRNNVNLFLELVFSFNLSSILKFIYALNNLSKVEHNKHKVKFKEIKI